jgi:putative ABC transport system permease protein
MALGEDVRIALGALSANKLRSGLTMLGIVIGVAAVIAVVSIIQGLERMITDQLQGVGTTFIQVTADFGPRGQAFAGKHVKLTWDDGKAIAERVGGIRRITPILLGRATLKYGDRDHTPPSIEGVSADYPEVANHAVDRGRFLSRIDADNRRNVVVLGRRVVEELGLGGKPLGREIYVGDHAATVIGVMEEKGQSLGRDLDDVAFVPFNAALTLFGRDAGDVVQLQLQAKDAAAVERVKDGITQVLRERHHLAAGEPDDFKVQVQDELLRTTGSILDNVTAVVIGVVGVALLVGGIGIMNIMLVSVTERTREIGLRKAVGARRKDVLVQFLIEAVTLSLAGGAIGLALGYGLGVLAAHLLPSWPPAHVPLWAVGVAFGFSGLVGIFFGSYPAGKAAGLDPIDALRYE